jgi:hypothetical protein
MNKVFYTLVIASLCLTANAQTDVDALRLNPYYLGSTAKMMSIAGSGGVVGADPSSAVINPAGLAQYRSNEMTITGSMLFGRNESVYLGESTRDNFSDNSFNNAYLVFSNIRKRNGVPLKKGIVNSTIGIGFNRTDNFEGLIHFNGDNQNNSYLDFVAGASNGLSVNYLGSGDGQDDYTDYRQMFWDAFLIDSFSDGSYFPMIEDGNVNVDQRNVVRRNGGNNDFQFSYAANYEHKLYFGLGVNLSTGRFEENNEFSELDNSEVTGPTNFTPWDEFALNSYYSNRFWSLNANFGLVYRVNNNLRFGGALQTPKVYTVNEEYGYELSAFYDDNDFGNYSTANNDLEISYQVSTPARLSINGAYIFEKKGFISADLEFVDYSTMRITSEVANFEDINDLIRTKYDNAVNLKIGGEAVKDQFRFRGGYALFGSPFADGEINSSQQAFTTGLGIHERSWGMDLAYIHRIAKSQTQPYEVNGFTVPVAENTTRTNQLVLTLSFKI